jgi:hypothetical protein
MGPKFKEYLELNFMLVYRYYWLMLALSCLGLGIVNYVLIISVLAKLYSQTLYHKQACLYQSVPVSSFETVLAKTVVGVVSLLVPMVVSLPVSGLKSLLNDTQFEVYEQLNLKELINMGETGSVLYILSMVALAFLICGIALFGVAVGNRARGNREKKPNTATAVLVIGGMLLILYGITWIMEQIQFSSPLLREILGFAGSTIGAGLMFWLNVRALDKWYSI